MKHNLKNFPKRKEETDYLLAFYRDAKKWKRQFEQELREIKRRIEDGTPNAKKYGAVTLAVLDQILGVES